jgi:hypothetical protein
MGTASLWLHGACVKNREDAQWLVGGGGVSDHFLLSPGGWGGGGVDYVQ